MSRICETSSEHSGPGATPDLEDSEEVLSWMWMLRGPGEGGREARPVLSWVAFLAESTEETVWRLGRVEARGLHLSEVGVSVGGWSGMLDGGEEKRTR